MEVYFLRQWSGCDGNGSQSLNFEELQIILLGTKIVINLHLYSVDHQGKLLYRVFEKCFPTSISPISPRSRSFPWSNRIFIVILDIYQPLDHNNCSVRLLCMCLDLFILDTYLSIQKNTYIIPYGQVAMVMEPNIGMAIVIFHVKTAKINR